MPTLVIRGTAYPSSNVVDLSLNDLRNLKRETGVSVGEFRELAKRLDGLGMEQVMDDEGALMAMSVIVWASRRLAGEQVTLEEACDFSLLDDLQVIPDEVPDEGDVEDPSSARPRESSSAGPRSAKPAKRTVKPRDRLSKQTASTRSTT